MLESQALLRSADGLHCLGSPSKNETNIVSRLSSVRKTGGYFELVTLPYSQVFFERSRAPAPLILVGMQG
jgi:hypothetical protein